MTLKWMAVVVAAVSVTVCVTTNVLVGPATGWEVVINMIAITLAGIAAVVAVVAELHQRIVAHIAGMSELLLARIDELESRAGDRDAGFVEGYLLGQTPDGSVVPIGPRVRGRRAMNGPDD